MAAASDPSRGGDFRERAQSRQHVTPTRDPNNACIRGGSHEARNVEARDSLSSLSYRFRHRRRRAGRMAFRHRGGRASAGGPQPADVRGRSRLAQDPGQVEGRRRLQLRGRCAGQRLAPASPAHPQARAGRHGGAARHGVRPGGQQHQGLGRGGQRIRMARARARHPHRLQGLRLDRRQQLSHQRPVGPEAGRRRPIAEIHAGRQVRHADRPQQPEQGQRRHRQPAPAGGRLGPSADQRAVRRRRLRQSSGHRLRRGYRRLSGACGAPSATSRWTTTIARS